MHLIKGQIIGKYKLARITPTPDVTAVCTEYISNVSNSFISQNWSIGCNYGTSYYTYYPVMYGWSTGTGQGPTIRSNNQLNAHCGTTPP